MEKFVHSGQISDTVTQVEMDNRHLARRAAAEGFVLLKNEGILPLEKKACYALFGGGALYTVKGGTGSGNVNERYAVSIKEGFENAGIKITDPLYFNDYKVKYEEARKAWLDKIMTASAGNPMLFFDTYAKNPFSYPDGREISEADINLPEGKAKAAVYVISRIAGEGCDRKKSRGDYYLSGGELRDLKALDALNIDIVVLINAGGAVDTTEISDIPAVKAIMVISQAGEEGGNAVSDVLFGDVTPSGKLAATWPLRYEDIPYSENFSSLNGDLKTEYYSEGIYTGYRYFATADVKPAFPFGFGLSYADFEPVQYSLKALGRDSRGDERFSVTVCVKNSSSAYSGKSVEEVYVLLPEGKMDKEKLRLIAFAKTGLIKPGDTDTVTVEFGQMELASFSEVCNAWVLEPGIYKIAVGESSDDLTVIGNITVAEEGKVLEAAHKFGPSEEDLMALDEMKNPAAFSNDRGDGYFKNLAEASNIEHFNLTVSELTIETAIEDDQRKKAFELADKLSVEELIPLLYGEISAGQGNTIGSAAIRVPGAAGETSGAYRDKLGIEGVIMADGPAGIRINRTYEVDGKTDHVYQADFFEALGVHKGNNSEEAHEGTVKYYQNCTAFPVGTLLAQSFNTDLIEEVGEAVSKEMMEYHIGLWLAPGMNIQRNPLCGRNFEYYSEDPLVSGLMAAAETKGVQKSGVTGVTIKHFAANNQEDNRMGVNAIISERALREIYLRGFEIAVRLAQPMSIMSSYNKINGAHSANNKALLSDILRDEWGFKGLVMTDWTTTSKFGGSIAHECAKAGNDIIMPGIHDDEKDIREAYSSGKLSGEEIKKAAVNVIRTALICSEKQ